MDGGDEECEEVAGHGGGGRRSDGDGVVGSVECGVI